jgi:hypothetical protein
LFCSYNANMVTWSDLLLFYLICCDCCFLSCSCFEP